MPQDFMQYQFDTVGVPKRRRQPAQGAQPPAQTPFMPNGQPMPQPQQPAQPAQPTQPQAAKPATPQPPPGMEGWTPYGEGGWLPPGHPDAQMSHPQGMVASPPPDPRLGQMGSVDARGVYNPGIAPTQVYNPQQVSRFRAPDLSAVAGPQQALITQLLNNPQTMTPQVVEQMKGREQDAAALMQRQVRDSILANAASRGISPNSGYAQGQLRALADSTNRGLLNSYRDIDIGAVGQNRSDMLNALGAGESFQNNALQRAISAYAPLLAGTQEQRAETTTGLDSALQRFAMQEGLLGNRASTLQAAIGGQRQEALANADRNQRESEFARNFGFSQDQFNYQKDQNNLARQDAASAASAANSRWLDAQAMAYQQSQEEQWNNLMGILLGGGGMF